MIVLCLFQESKNIIFTCGDSKNHSWPSPLVIFSVPTRENNVFSLYCTVILHCYVHRFAISKVDRPPPLKTHCAPSEIASQFPPLLTFEKLLDKNLCTLDWM
jgi:hypothetical protein